MFKRIISIGILSLVSFAVANAAENQASTSHNNKIIMMILNEAENSNMYDVPISEKNISDFLANYKFIPEELKSQAKSYILQGLHPSYFSEISDGVFALTNMPHSDRSNKIILKSVCVPYYGLGACGMDPDKSCNQIDDTH